MGREVHTKALKAAEQMQLYVDFFECFETPGGGSDVVFSLERTLIAEAAVVGVHTVGAECRLSTAFHEIMIEQASRTFVIKDFFKNV